MSLTFKATGSQAVPVDVPFRWFGILERGRPRPLNPPLMQTQTVLLDLTWHTLAKCDLMVPHMTRHDVCQASDGNTCITGRTGALPSRRR